MQAQNDFIIKNYRNMKYKDIAKHLGLSYSTVCTRITRLRKRGEIGSKEQTVDWTGAGRVIEPKPMPELEFNTGDRYKHHILRTHPGQKQLYLREETCIILQDCKKHVTVQYKNYKVCILKADLMLGLEKLERVN